MLNAYVYVVESPSADDLFDGRTEGRALCEALALSATRHSYTVCVDRARLERAFILGQSERFAEEFEKHQSESQSSLFFPIVHFSAHGNADGIQLTSGEYLSWTDLRELLRPINERMPNGLLVCFSSCNGANGVALSMTPKNQRPFFGCVGTNSEVLWEDALVGFVTFYHHFFKGSSVADTLQAMKIASTDDHFYFESGIETQRKFNDYVANFSARSASPTFGGLFGL